MRRERLSGVDLERYLVAVTDTLVRTFAPQTVVLFGSFARGDQNRASDLDVVVIADTDLPFHERIGRALESCYRVSTRLPVEALVYTPAEWTRMTESGNSFAGLVQREGRVLYDSGSQPGRRPALAHAGPA